MEKVFKVLSEFTSKEINKDNFTVKVKVSDNSVDRSGEVIDTSAWKETIPVFMKHPVLLSSHNIYSTLKNQIGEIKGLETNRDGLWAELKYYVGKGNEEADWAWFLVEQGIAAYSVGFIPQEVEDNPEDKNVNRKYLKNELIEVSQVLIPANPNAIQDRTEETFENEEMKELQEVVMKKFENVVMKPYPNEHSCRLEDPKGFDKFTRKNCYIKKDGKCIDVIFGIKDKKSKIQALRFQMDTWSKKDAQAYCKEKGGMFEAGKPKKDLETEPEVKEIEDNNIDIATLHKDIQGLISQLKTQNELFNKYFSEISKPQPENPVEEKQNEEQEETEKNNERPITKKELRDIVKEVINNYFH